MKLHNDGLDWHLYFDETWRINGSIWLKKSDTGNFIETLKFQNGRTVRFPVSHQCELMSNDRWWVDDKYNCLRCNRKAPKELIKLLKTNLNAITLIFRMKRSKL